MSLMSSVIINKDGSIHRDVRLNLGEMLDVADRYSDRDEDIMDWVHDQADLPEGWMPYNCSMEVVGSIEGDIIVRYTTYPLPEDFDEELER